MVLIKWDNSFSVGVSSVDEQHKKLFDLINKLFEAMKVGKGKDVLGGILKELIDYTVYHFKYEEDKFIEFGYNETIQHKAEHKKLVDQVTDFKKKFDKGETITIELMNFLKEWLTNHINGTDKKYTKCFNENGLK